MKNIFILLILFGSSLSQTHQLMPIPESIQFGNSKFELTSDFTVSVTNQSERLNQYIRRVLFRLDNRSAVYFTKDIQNSNGQLSIEFERIEPSKLGMVESYSLDISDKSISLKSETDIGIMRGLETLTQLLTSSKDGFYFPEVKIKDHPRFIWRGLLIDVARHWMPVDVIKRNLDGMAAVKLNTFHWHLTEDQGFRVESKVFPKLHQLGSNGDFYTQDQIKDVIKYANDRGIRVMPEFDIPGHATSWFVGHPEISSKDMDYKIEKGFGVFDPAIDPTKEATYQFLDRFLTEMAGLFNDEYLHIGGDENNGKHWDANESIQKFMKENNIKDNHQLQSYFNGRLLEILTRNNKRMVGWDEIFQPELPNTIVIQSWRGKKAMIEAAQKGYKSILSNGYYIDLVQSAEKHYLNEPIPDDHGLTKLQLENILGGEATMWAELITPETIDSRIWPRTAAIAERFWSPRTITDVNDMYRRLENVSIQLENVGLNHRRNQDMMIRRFLNTNEIQSFKVFIQVIEPLKGYARHGQGVKYSTDLPMTRLPDILFPESPKSREFKVKINQFLLTKNTKDAEIILTQANVWLNNHVTFEKLIEHHPYREHLISMSKDIHDLSKITIEAVKFITGKKRMKGLERWKKSALEVISNAKKPRFESEIAIVTEIEKLVMEIK